MKCRICYRKRFFTYLTKTIINAAGVSIKSYTFIVEISQSSIDLAILNLIASYFNAGYIYSYNGISRFRLTKKKIGH